MVGRVVKRIPRLVRGMIVHPIRYVIVVVALAGVTLVMLQAGLPAFSFSLPSSSFKVGSGGAPTSTESYMKGTETFNAELVWNALSDEAQGGIAAVAAACRRSSRRWTRRSRRRAVGASHVYRRSGVP